MPSLVLFAAGRRGKYAVLAVVATVAIALTWQANGLSDVQRNDVIAFLPGESESVRVLEALKRFPSGARTSAVVVFRRAGGLTVRDRERVTGDRRALDRHRVVLGLPVPRPRFTARGDAAILVVPLRATADENATDPAVDQLRSRTRAQPTGLEVKVTGAAAFGRDINAQVAGIDGMLLLAASALVLVLLILIYRSPIFWAIPFLSVVLAVGAAQGLAYLLARAGLNVDAQGAGILSVLVFGAGTDYALLLIARYREELSRHPDIHRAMREALRASAPAIVASALAVMAALLTLTVAEVTSSASLGPVGAGGVLVAMVCALTLLPAALLVAGRRAFWPRIPRPGANARAAHHRWDRLGRAIARRPRVVALSGLVGLVVLATGNLGLDTNLSPTDQFRSQPEAVTGQELLARSFPAGASAPIDVLVPAGQVNAALHVLRGRRDLLASAHLAERGPRGQAHLTGTLARDPYGTAAPAGIPVLRHALAPDAPDALVGGPTAQQYDLRHAADRDNRVIPPLAVAVVFIIVAGLLRALLGPLLLIVVVVVNFAASLGVATLVSTHLLELAAVAPSAPLLSFVFLVALGADYTIFLVTRVREEARCQKAHHAVLAGLSATGSVITSAGLVLAGTFAALAVVPLVLLTQIGFTVAFGVLLDTLFVRSLIVPALMLTTGRRFWWPSRLARPRPTPRIDREPAP